MVKAEYGMRDVDGLLFRLSICKRCDREIVKPLKRGPAPVFCDDCKREKARERYNKVVGDEQ